MISRNLKMLLLRSACRLSLLVLVLFVPMVATAQDVQIFQHCDFGGWTANFTLTGDSATFNTADILSRSGLDNDASSIKIKPGFRVTLFDGNNQSGRSLVLTTDNTCFVDENFNDILSSIRIERIPGAALVQIFQHRDFN